MYFSLFIRTNSLTATFVEGKLEGCLLVWHFLSYELGGRCMIGKESMFFFLICLLFVVVFCEATVG